MINNHVAIELTTTATPICPDYSGNANPCSLYEEECCPTHQGLCQWSTSELCQNEGGPFCCELVSAPIIEPTESTSIPITCNEAHSFL